MARISDPTPLEQVQAALVTAGHDQASYQPPNLNARPPYLGGCFPGWVVQPSYGAWLIVAFRPAGLMSSAESYAVQAGTLEGYVRNVFTEANGWEHMWSRREGIPALLVRRAEAGHE